jgi:hypothetical protein
VADKRDQARSGRILVERGGMVETGDIRRFVVDTFLFGDGQGLEDDTSFLDQGVIDSAGMLELITFLSAGGWRQCDRQPTGQNRANPCVAGTYADRYTMATRRVHARDVRWRTTET